MNKQYLIGPTLGYSITMGEKWVFNPGVFYHFGKMKEASGLITNDPNYIYNQFTSDLKVSTAIYGAGIAFKRHFGQKSNNESGGFYLLGSFSLAYGHQNVTVSKFDTSIYYYVHSQMMDEDYLSESELDITLKNKLRCNIGLGFDREITDVVSFYVDGGFDLLDVQMFDLTMYVHIGIRKKFLNL